MQDIDHCGIIIIIIISSLSSPYISFDRGSDSSVRPHELEEDVGGPLGGLERESGLEVANGACGLVNEWGFGRVDETC